MMFKAAAFAAGLLGLAAAAPMAVEERQAKGGSLSTNDTTVLQLAHYLENLEYALYTEGYNQFSDAQYTAAGFPAGFRGLVGLTASQEATHRDTLASILTSNGVTPLPACTYTFPFNSPATFVEVANMITSGGIGAYLGGAMLLTDNSTLLTAAGGILTVEARHDAALRAGAGGSPFPTPFDTALTAEWIFSLVQQFIVSCPQQLPGFVAFPPLTVTSPSPSLNLQPPVPAGTSINLKWNPAQFYVHVDPNSPLYVAFVNQNIEQVQYAKVQNLNFAAGTGSVPLPSGVAGVVFAALTTFAGGLDEAALTSFGTLAGPTEIVVS